MIKRDLNEENSSGAAEQQRPRVLHFVQSSNAGGTETAVLYLCRAMPDETVGAVFKKNGVIIPRFERAGIRTLALDSAPAQTDLEELAREANIIDFHLFTPEPLVPDLIDSTGLRPITTLQWYTRLPVQNHPIICASGAVAATQDRNNRTFTIHNGVDPDEFTPGVTRSKRRPVVARIGREAKLSSHFKSVTHLILEGTDAELWIIGADGEDSERVRYLGVRHDIPELLRNIDVLVHTPFPRQGAHDMIVLEAMASTVPVVAFDVECVRECFPDSDAGCLVPFGDIKAMTARIAELLNDDGKRRRMGRLARQTVEERFTAKRMAERYRTVYRWLLAEGQPLPDLDVCHAG